MSDLESSFSNDNLPEKSPVDNKIPKSPAVATYESYASWRSKRFPPRTLDYNAKDYTPSASENTNFSNQNQNSALKKSSYFPTEDQYTSENHSNHHPDSMLPRSSYFSVDSENLTSEKRNYERRSFPSYENQNSKIFHGNEHRRQLSPNIIRNSGNKISKEVEHCLKRYSRLDQSSPSLKHKVNSYNPDAFSSNSKIQNFNQLKKSDYNQPSPNAGALQPVRHKSEHRHSFPSCCQVDNKNRESESGEMVKGLLKLIDNQNEQIKHLQAQLDRLLSIHEETLKERAKCICSLEISRQNPQICMQAYNAALHAKQSATITDSYSNNEISKFPEFNQMSECSKSRNVQFEDHSKKALMERKVSIGVMTSFELTVQNSPFNNDSENQPIVEEHVEEEIYKESVNQDHSKRKQNLFSRMPSALENIIEDSESHLSSSQQPSSNLSSCKGVNLQIQNGRGKNSPGNNSNNFTNFNRSNSPSNFNKSKSPVNFHLNQNSPQNFTNSQNRREENEFRVQKDYSNSLNKDGVTQELLKNREFRASREEDETNKEKEIQRFETGGNKRSDENFEEESLVLSEGQVEVKDRGPPSPAPSIHIDMDDFSSEEGSVMTKRTPKVGWTFYNNILGQVNNILKNSPLQEDRNKKDPQLQEIDKNILIDTVKAATIDQLKKLGISFHDNEKEANAKKYVNVFYFTDSLFI